MIIFPETRLLFAIVLMAFGSICSSPVYSDEGTIGFESQIRPILLKHCADCHGPDDQQSSLRLDARHAAFKGGDGGPVIAPGRSNQSELIKRITSIDTAIRMPPEGPSLTQPEIDLLKAWIDDGANWPETDYDRAASIDKRLQHWAFQPVKQVEPPTATPSQSDALQLSMIDRFIVAKLLDHGLQLSPRADHRTLIRRLSFDLLGLPPTPERIQAFNADSSPDAWVQLIEEMLASPHYGERWAQHWLDVVRYADTHGFEVNTPRDNAWPYRDYVIRAFNEDKPYDQFIREQLAGDVYQADDATGFLVASAVLLPGQIGKDEESKRLARQDALDEIIVGTAGTMLGLTIGCARCHDHKFDPVTARDYYAMQAFFAGVDYGDRPVKDAASEQQMQQARELVPQIESLERQLRELETPVFTGQTIIIDEENSTLTEALKAPNGPGANPEGTQRGYRDDPGSAQRIGNISNGRYTWWNNTPGEDVLTYNPAVSGRFDLWISWGAHGSGVHTRDARYVLDSDGDLTTRNEQSELAAIDQYYLAGISDGETERTPLWSGLAYVGKVDLTDTAKIVLRGGETGTGITADVIVLQEVDRVSTSAWQPTQPRLRSPLIFTENIDRFAPRQARFVRFTTFETHNNNQYEPCIDELEVYTVASDDGVPRNVALASNGGVAASSGNYSETGRHQLKHINDGQYGNERSWISNQRGGGWVQIELAQPEIIDRVVWGRDRNGQFRDRLSVRYAITVSLDGQNWTTVATDTDRAPANSPHDSTLSLLRNAGPANTYGKSQHPVDLSGMISKLDQLRKEKTRLEQPRLVYGGVFREPDTTFVLRRGNPEQRLEEIRPAIPAVFTALMADDKAMSPHGVFPTAEPALTPEQQRRVALADWVTSPSNPLTARVMVNRIWQYHFGRGIVDTPSDFGLNGVQPTHPELLDWLATEFIRSGWSIKHVHRLILTSMAYQQSHQIQQMASAVDQDNRLLWRFASHRLEAEVIRDSMLFITGELNTQAGGPGFNFFKTRGGLNGFPPLEQFSSNEMRRMIYAHKVRMEQVPVFGAFDCPDAGQAMPRRSQSTTAIQALNLFNSPFVNERAAQLAARVEKERPTNQHQQVLRAFQLTLGRDPSATELQAALQTSAQHGFNSVCRVLFNCSEFLFAP